MKDKLETEIGEKGIRLSGGQKQRLAIAKLMLKDPSIILLDEPTSALDSFSEDEVTKALHNLFKNRTVIIIAHRLQTVKHADEIIVLGSEEQGTQILERGKHKELQLTKFVYWKKKAANRITEMTRAKDCLLPLLLSQILSAAEKNRIPADSFCLKP